ICERPDARAGRTPSGVAGPRGGVRRVHARRLRQGGGGVLRDRAFPPAPGARAPRAGEARRHGEREAADATQRDGAARRAVLEPDGPAFLPAALRAVVGGRAVEVLPLPAALGTDEGHGALTRQAGG